MMRLQLLKERKVVVEWEVRVRTKSVMMGRGGVGRGGIGCLSSYCRMRRRGYRGVGIGRLDEEDTIMKRKREREREDGCEGVRGKV